VKSGKGNRLKIEEWEEEEEILSRKIPARGKGRGREADGRFEGRGGGDEARREA
jgi:hypothetical protein